MEKNQYNLCVEVLRRLRKADVLENMILIGSWCMPFYKDYFSGTAYSPSMKTRDIDFLISRRSAIKARADLPALMKDLGFILDFRGREGYIILEHPELAIEFLVPERGRGVDKPVLLPQLGLNAQALRFLELLAKDTITVKVEGISISLPHPANFALHKLLVARRRGRKDKSEKDREAGLKVLKALIDQNEQRHIRRVFDSVSKKWQKTILIELEAMGESRLIEGLVK